MKYTLSLLAAIIIALAAVILARKNSSKGEQLKPVPAPGRFTNILLFSLVLITGIAVRTYLFGDIPNGLYLDEAAVGYNAYSLLHYGIDYNGFSNPVIFVSFGSGQHALYGYLSMPFIAWLGLNTVSVRLAALILGILSLVVFYLLVTRTDDVKTALVALFLLAINPWHIMISRWGLDCNPLPAVFLFATYFLACSFKNERYFLLSMVLYGAALYAYGTAYFIVPIFILMLVATLIYHKKISPKILLGGLALLGLVGLPIALYVAINLFHWDSIQTAWISIPRMPGPARYSQVSIFFSNDGFFKSLLDNASNFVRLLIYQDDRLIWNAIPEFGTTYLFSLPLALLGLWALIREQARGRTFRLNFIFLAWLAASILLALVMPVIINRINILFIPLVYLIAKGVIFILNQSRLLGAALLLLFMVWFALFSNFYFTGYPERISTAFNESLDQAINYSSDHTDQAIYVTNKIPWSYIYVLFYRKIDPNEFLKSVRYLDPEAPFREVASFGQYRFMETTEMPPDGGAYIIENREQNLFARTNYELKQYKYYSVFLNTHQ